MFFPIANNFKFQIKTFQKTPLCFWGTFSAASTRPAPAIGRLGLLCNGTRPAPAGRQQFAKLEFMFEKGTYLSVLYNIMDGYYDYMAFCIY